MNQERGNSLVVTTRRLLSAAALVAACTLAAPAQPSTAESAPKVGGFGVRPAQPERGVAASRAYVVQRLRPGARYRNRVVVDSAARTPLRLRVYPVDGQTGATSGAVYGPPGRRPTRAGAWISVARTRVTVPPRGRVAVPFEVRVPRGTRPGDHLGAIAVQPTRATRASSGDLSTRAVVRAAMAVHVEVPGPARFQPRLTSLGIDTQPTTGRASVAVGIGDSGRRLGKPRLEVELAGPGGYRRTVARRLDTLLPGDLVTYPLAWPDRLRPGWYDVVATATGGGRPATLRARVHVGAAPAEPVPAGAGAPGSGGPWPLVGLGAMAGALLGVAGWRLRRRLRDRPLADLRPEPGGADA